MRNNRQSSKYWKRNRVAAGVLLLCLPLFASTWQMALPGYHYAFPRDNFNHPEYQTEWWYYTGNLHTAEGRRFGFELTFFRQGVDQSAQDKGIWNLDQVYLAHLALSDIDGRQFFHTERLNRAGPGLAGVNFPEARIWNGNWQVHWTSLTHDQQTLEAVCDQFALHLNLDAQKPPVTNGKNGVSQKGANVGEASHYVSLSRLLTSGQLTLKGAAFTLQGVAWMDHEFFSQVAHPDLAGWDWFAIQLDNNEELMLYRLRQLSGTPSPFSSGTYVDSHAHAHFLEQKDFSLSSAGEWLSPLSHARYPLRWRIQIPRLDLDLVAKTDLTQQELYSKGSVSPSYWEGAMRYEGQMHAKPVTGVGYLEMTGYDRAFRIGL